MRMNFPTLMERPENGNIFASLIYEVIAFFSLPFLLLLFLQGSFNNGKVVAAMEIFYHVINFGVALFIYREYLSDTFDDLRHDVKRLMKTVSLSSALILLIALVAHALFGFSGGLLSLTAYGTLPLAEVELFTLSSNLILFRPILGTACMVFLAPLTISCLFYGTVFAPICYTRPVLAYIAMAVFLAFPRYCNAATFWDPATEWTLYFTQLPLHMIACWSYQKTDSIWAPILTHTIVNAVACVLLIAGAFLGIL